jgi:hypothetical protein
MTKTHPLTHRIVAASAVIALALILSQCSEDEGFIPEIDQGQATSIGIYSGNNQYSLHGTELPQPLGVEVRNEVGEPMGGVEVTFVAIQGGGSVSEGSVLTDANGRASTWLTLGSTTGINQVRARVESNASLTTLFSATSSNFFCPEAEDSLKICASCSSEYGPRFDLFLVTARSSLFPDNSAGIVQPNVSSQTAVAFTELPPPQFLVSVVWDGVFSTRGDYFVARRSIFPEIVKVGVDKTITRFAGLDQSTIDDSVELAANPAGLLVGCDIRGPFVVACRDTIVRFSQATYTDGINNDALAVDPRRQSQDPLGEDIYFIDTSDRTLYRLPMDSMSVEPQGLQPVVQLTTDQAAGARGMVCDGFDGSIYIVVDTDDTKELLKVTSGGVVSQLVDFFSRGSGSAEDAGMQSDLALLRPLLFTIDTLNDKLLVYNLGGTFTPLFSDSIQQAKLSERAMSGSLAGGERVGLDVLR